MLDLRAKLLAAGLVTEEQVKKVEEDEAARRQRAKDVREARRHSKRPAAQATSKGPPARKAEPDDPFEKEARREHQLVEADRWRKRVAKLAAAGKAEQYEVTRGWVLRHRLDSKQISESAERFYFSKMDGSVSYLTVEPDVREQLAAGEAALVAFMGFNGLEHAVVPKDVALDIQQVKPEWLRALVGVTHAAAEPASTPAEQAAPAEPVASSVASEPVSDT